MRIIHNVNYDVTSQLEFRKIIYQNIIKVRGHLIIQYYHNLNDNFYLRA